MSQAICDPLENSDLEIAETEQTLINRNIKTERQTITLSKKSILWKNAQQKKTDKINLASQKEVLKFLSVLPLKNTVFSPNESSLKMDFI